MNQEMLKPAVTISWCPQDLINAFDYSEEDAVAAMDFIAGTLEDRSIELGWEVINDMINDYELSLDNANTN